ncbi:ADL266Cp [Eremothecium gossypii ATCC 10895]|uniref:Metacaspase-1 n=1 Tax=Eremothecium gossypii (strain ATCC 10895 / CBS 109.51 / FGSC 9923 / NRRL Y-1056) TaxID=284811 RepID=MCA1_EREGS|nr:ADL266Cp [Eremothecium gossypii ATCC 10895]Q75B43.1 RecName: Full=Metacaspase-1; Flags: Precursor [Eremothecium gossypii ATCC 10895]AAS51654.1 ADL266Cp [Eremothecium gossypii ATCC 10895]AEY95950.1 FADL266Cp [Eremothecium gossypii FDAG1]
MYPGAGRPTYHKQQEQKGPYGQPQYQQQYAPPYPERYQQPYYQPPPHDGYSRPSMPPPSHNYAAAQYERPSCPPPGYAPHQGGFPAPGPPLQGRPRDLMRSDIQMNHSMDYSNIQGPASYTRPEFVAPPPQERQFLDPGNRSVEYQYSQCTGNRKALLIGINYFNSSAELRGCINDVQNIKNFLISRYGYREENMVILTDDQHDPVRIPTKANILRAMHWLVQGAQPNDSLFLHYSGHGGETEDLDGDEQDGKDSTLYPVDFETNGHIVDDEIHDILVKPLAPGVRLTALIDACHSGSALDLPYMYSTKGIIKEPNVWKDIGSNSMQAAMAYVTGNTGDMFTSLKSLASTVSRKATGSGGVDTERVRQTKFSPADVIMFSGSKDNQTSADAVENGVATGAMSYSFVKVMSQQPQQTYLSLLQNMRTELKGKYTQKPQLSCSHPLDVNLQFVL